MKRERGLSFTTPDKHQLSAVSRFDLVTALKYVHKLKVWRAVLRLLQHSESIRSVAMLRV